MLKSTKYKLLSWLALTQWSWMLVIGAIWFCFEAIAQVTRYVADWIYEHTPRVPKSSTANKMREKQIAALWEEYGQRKDADPRVMAGKPR